MGDDNSVANDMSKNIERGGRNNSFLYSVPSATGAISDFLKSDLRTYFMCLNVTHNLDFIN